VQVVRGWVFLGVEPFSHQRRGIHVPVLVGGGTMMWCWGGLGRWGRHRRLLKAVPLVVSCLTVFFRRIIQTIVFPT
jgi:hypothetical protein